MEELALKLNKDIDLICGGFHYYKDEQVLEKARELLEDIRIFCNSLLQAVVEDERGQEQVEFQHYVLGVLQDYVEALEQQDMVLMLDVLDYGLRELLHIYIEENEEDKENESGNF